MADVQTTQATQQLPIYFGGSFDLTVLGAPIYFWWIFFEGIAIFCILVMVAYYRFWIMNDIWGMVDCIRKHKAFGLVRNRSRQAYFKAMDYIASVFTDEKDPTNKYYASALESSNAVSGAPLIDICDYYDWLQDPFLNEAIKTIIEAWNNGEPNFDTEKEWIDHKPDPNNESHWIQGHKPHPESEKIFDGPKFQELLGSGKLKDYFDKTEVTTYIKGSIRVKAFFIINVSQIEQYLPKNRSSAILGGHAQILVDRLGGKDVKEGLGMLKWFAIGCTAIIICSLIGAIILRGSI